MAIALALITSALWGTSDFFGGLATQRVPVARVMLWAHGLGLIAITLVAPILAETFAARDLVLGAIAGLVGMVGLLLLYQGLSRGPMAVVAPLSAITAALLPVLWGLGSNDPLSDTTLVGLLVGLAAVVAISWEGNLDVDGAPITARVIGEAILAGCCFGSIVLIFDAASDGSAPWPIVSGRLVTTTVLLLFAYSRRRPILPTGIDRSVKFAAIAGLGDTFANVTLLLATNEAVGSAELSVVAVVSAFFPAATVIWARFLLREPLGPIRLFGLALGLGAITLMTVG